MPPFAQYYLRVKNVVHAIHALAIFLAWAIIIAILAKGGKPDGRVGYYFALCWCCIPAIIYQTAFPAFQRIRRFSNAYLHAIIDIVYTILWLAAFACLIAWVEQGSHAAKDWKNNDRVCDKFAWGPVSKCKLGQGAWILGVIICLLFAVTAAFSIYGVACYRKNGSEPEYSVQDADRLTIEDHGFSVGTNDKVNDHESMQLNPANGAETGFTHMNAEDQNFPSGPIPYNLQQPHTAPADLGYEPADTGHYSGGHPFESSHRPQSQPVYQYPANNSPYNTHHFNESRVVGGLPTQIGGAPSGHHLALEYDHGGYGSGGRVNFPEGHYGR